jgi:hypothetical protein
LATVFKKRTFKTFRAVEKFMVSLINFLHLAGQDIFVSIKFADRIKTINKHMPPPFPHETVAH